MVLEQYPLLPPRHKFLPGDFAYVYREGLKHYTGPHLIASVHGKEVRVHTGESSGPRSFNVAQLRPADVVRSSDLPPPPDPASQGPPRVLYTEDVLPGDPRESLFGDAIRKEILGLIERGTFRLTLLEEAGDNPNVIPCRYVLTIKHALDGTVRYKARFDPSRQRKASTSFTKLVKYEAIL